MLPTFMPKRLVLSLVTVTVLALFNCNTDLYAQCVSGNVTLTSPVSIQASGSVTTSGQVSVTGTTSFEAATVVTLGPGFAAMKGSSFHAFMNNCTPGSGGITNYALASGTLLEVNLGPTPISYYSNLNCQPGFSDCATNVQSRFIAPCSATSTVRQCYQAALNVYKQTEEVTGVRFLFALCGGWYSSPLSNCGPNGTVTFDPTGSWRQQVAYLFADIYNSGIRNITPTFALVGFSGEAGVTSPMSGYDNCGYGGANASVVWWPALPFPLRSSDGLPYGWQISGAYGCAPFNTVNFVGYTNIYTVMDSILNAASSQNLNVEEFDINNETPFHKATVWARLVFDNKDTSVSPPGRAVLNEWRYYLTKYNYPWTNLTFSLQDGGSSSTTANYDCASVYGDSARVLPASDFVALVGGGAFGWPNPAYMNNLPCGGSASLLFSSLPTSYSEPAILDMHTGPCLTVVNVGGCVVPQAQNDAAVEAQTTFSDTETFLNSFCASGWRHNSTQLCGALYMQGEVPVYQPSPSNAQLNCDLSPIVLPAAAVQGFNNSTLAGRTLSSGQPGVIFRPWVDATGVHDAPVCWGFPQVLQPTFLPTP